VVFPLEALVWFCWMCSMRSHIHAWNMAQGCLDERKIWFNLVYGRVVRGSSRPGCILHMLIRASFLLYLMVKYTCLYLVFMVVISLLFLLVIC